MRRGFVCEPIPNSNYRALFPLRAREKRGHTVVWPVALQPGTPLRELLGCDLVHWYRRMDRIGDLRALSARGVAVNFDNDDNYAALEVSEAGSGLDARLHNLKRFRSTVQAAKLADLTTTPSPVLADSYRSAGASGVAVIENHLERDMFGFGSKLNHDGVVVGWIASMEHTLDMEQIPVVAALKQLLDAHPDVRVLSVGIRLPISSERYEQISEVEFRDILTITGRIDIGIAPLADTTFNRSRSDSKLKEYSSGGATWLASPVGPYCQLGEKQGGGLVDDHEWFTAIDALIRNPRHRNRMARRALKWAKSQTIDHFASSWEHAFTSAIDRAHERVSRSGAR